MKDAIWRTGLIAVAAVMPVIALAQPTDTRQCDGNAVIYCGAYSPTELAFKIEHGDGHNPTDNLTQVLYNEGRNITADSIATSVDGDLAGNGQVTVGGKVVATGAVVAGRDDVQGATKDGSLYDRSAATLVADGSAGVLVDMTGGTFHWAVVKQNGDPVKATAGQGSGATTPTPTATPTPATPTPATPTPTPATPTPTLATPAPTPVVTPAPVASTTPTTVPDTGGTGAAAPLPQTGPESALGGAAGLTSLGFMGRQYLRSRRSLKAALRGK